METEKEELGKHQRNQGCVESRNPREKNISRRRRFKCNRKVILRAGRGGSRGQEIETIVVNMVKPRLY